VETTITRLADIILWVLILGNTASGYNSLPSNTTGTYNSDLVFKHRTNIYGNRNTAIGVAAMTKKHYRKYNAILAFW
jgi:hypothetical protein